MAYVVNLELEGFNTNSSRVTLVIREDGKDGDILNVTGRGERPEALLAAYSCWRDTYLRLPSSASRIVAGAVGNIPISSASTREDYDRASQDLQIALNQWLQSWTQEDGETPLNVLSRCRRAIADPHAEVRAIVRTEVLELRRLPWHLWELFAAYPKLEISLGRRNFERQPQQPNQSKKARILAILGVAENINVGPDWEQLQKSFGDDAEIKVLERPSREKLEDPTLWEQGWDMLFFAGHSNTEGDTGRIYFRPGKDGGEKDTPDPEESLTLEELEPHLEKAIATGLQVAIFNSCDGLGLARTLEEINIPQAIVMREPVEDEVAQEFLKRFLTTYARPEVGGLYAAMRETREWLQAEVEAAWPGASWLPAIVQHPAAKPPRWLELSDGKPANPYRGLMAFDEDDADVFFGRESETARLVAMVREQPLVTVVGASGSGKSSLVKAGLFPALRGDEHWHWQIRKLRPGTNPLAALAEALAPLVPGMTVLKLETILSDGENALRQVLDGIDLAPQERLLLFVDQFEEAYTLCEDPIRQQFLHNLQTAIRGELQGGRSTPRVGVVLTLRADFLGCFFDYPEFNNLLLSDRYRFELDRMKPKALQRSIVGPASSRGVLLKPGLVERLLAAVGEKADDLPLLEFALTQLWEKMVRGQLTLEAYEAIGGLGQALAIHADGVYADLCKDLSEIERQALEQFFVRLVRPGDKDDTKAVVPRGELTLQQWEWALYLDEEERRLARVESEGKVPVVELVHEALIRHWQNLKDWVKADREFRLWQDRQMAADLQAWLQSDRSKESLLGKLKLDKALEWQKQGKVLSPPEVKFIKESVADLERKDSQRKWRQRLTIGISITVAAVMTVLGGLALLAQQRAEESLAKEAEATEEARQREKEAEKERREAEAARELANKEKLKAQEATEEAQAERDAAVQARDAEAAARQAEEVATAEAKKERDRAIKQQLEVERQLILSLEAEARALSLQDRTFEGMLVAARAIERRLEASVINPLLSNYYSLLGSIYLSNSADYYEKNRLQGHAQYIEHAIFSPDGQILASAGRDATVKLWSREGKELATLEGHSGPVFYSTFSPDSQLIATISLDDTIKLWDREGKELATLKGHFLGQTFNNPQGFILYATAEVQHITFSPDGQILASAGRDATVKLWSREGKELATLEGHSERVTHVIFSPDGQTIASASVDGTVRLWQRDGSPLATTWQGNWVGHVAFSPDGQTIASASVDGTVKLWQRDGTPRAALKGHSEAVDNVVFSPDGQILASAGSDGTVRLWSREGKELAVLQGYHNGFGNPVLEHVTFSPNGKILAFTGDDNTLQLWSREGQKLTTLQHDGPVITFAFSPSDGQILASASGGGDASVKLWSRESQKLSPIFIRHGQSNKHVVTFSPDGQSLTNTSNDGTVKQWDLEGKELTTFQGHRDEDATSIFKSPDGQIIASVSLETFTQAWSGILKLRTPDGREIATIEAHSDIINHVAFNSDSQTLASASDDGTVKLWSREGQELETIFHGYGRDFVRHVAFSPDGQALASASSDRTVRLWSLDGRELATLRGHTDRVNHVAFSSDSQTLASASDDGTVKLWSREGQELTTLKVHSGAVTYVIFSPDGQTLASASDDGIIRLWPSNGVTLHKRACSWLKDYLTHNSIVTTTERKGSGCLDYYGSQE